MDKFLSPVGGVIAATQQLHVQRTNDSSVLILKLKAMATPTRAEGPSQKITQEGPVRTRGQEEML